MRVRVENKRRPSLSIAISCLAFFIVALAFTFAAMMGMLVG